MRSIDRQEPFLQQNQQNPLNPALVVSTATQLHSRHYVPAPQESLREYWKLPQKDASQAPLK